MKAARSRLLLGKCFARFRVCKQMLKLFRASRKCFFVPELVCFMMCLKRREQNVTRSYGIQLQFYCYKWTDDVDHSCRQNPKHSRKTHQPLVSVDISLQVSSLCQHDFKHAPPADPGLGRTGRGGADVGLGKLVTDPSRAPNGNLGREAKFTF